MDEPEDASPEAGLAMAARPVSVLAGPYGRPFHPVAAAVAIGAWVCAFGFDVLSRLADVAWIYERGAYVLTGAGVAAGVVAAMLGLADLVRVPRGTPAFTTGLRHLVTMDVALVLFAVSFLIRHGSSWEWHEGTASLPLGLSVVGLAVLGFGTWLGLTLASTYGVRVAEEPDRLRGFEPEA